MRLLVLGDEQHLLLVCAHHIVFDAWSADVFTRDLVALYGRFAGGPPAELPELPIRFADHAADTRSEARVEAATDQLAHWRRRLADAPPASTLPADFPRPPVQTHRGRRRPFALSSELAGRLSDLGRSAGVTVNAVVLAGLAAALRRATGQDDLVLGLPSAGRSQTALEPMIGCFANMLMVRVDLSGDPTVRELVARAHAAVRETYAHQDAPYARVVEEVAPPRDPSLNPLFQVMLTVADEHEEDRSAAGVRFAPAPIDDDVTDFDLFVTLTRRGGELAGTIAYNTDLYLEETIAQTVGRLPAVLEAMVGRPDARIQEIGPLRRDTVAIAGTFTADLVRAPLEYWLRFLRMPAGVTPIPYGQLIPHLLADEEAAASVCLLRWEDWLRHYDGDDPVEAMRLLAAGMADLEAGVRAYRHRTEAPLVLVVCLASPAFQASPWRERLSRLDDRLALLASRMRGVDVIWAGEQAGREPGGETFDPVADRLGHVPYTVEYSAALGTMAARALWRASGHKARTLLVDSQLPWRAQLVRLVGDRHVVTSPAGALLEAEMVEPCLLLDPDPELVAAIQHKYPHVTALTVPESWDEAERFLAGVWLLDRPATARTGLFTDIGPERATYMAEQLASSAAVVERLRPRAPGPATSEAMVAPRTATEERLVAVWRTVLELDEISVTGDFFALGGHSLLATQLLSRIHAELGAELSLYTLFTNSTVEQLARVLDEQGPTSAEPLPPAPDGAELVASSMQERLWALARLDDETVRHNTNFAAVLRGALDENALQHAVLDLVSRHEALRTTFTERRGRPAPFVHGELDCRVTSVDLSGLHGRELDRAVRREHQAHLAHVYDLDAGPLLQARVLRLAAEEHHLLVGMHHIICDNTSWSVFLEELAASYNAFATGASSPLEAPPTRFTDFAFHQRAWLESAAAEPHVAYWRERLRDIPVLELTTDHARPATRSDVAGHHAGMLPTGLGAAVRELARAEGVSPFAVLSTAFGLLLRRESGASDLVIGVPTAGRERPELERVIGCFTDLLPLRMDLSAGLSFRQLVQRAHTASLEGYRHQSVPFAEIVDALRLPRDPSRHPVFDCVFNLIDLPDDAPGFAGLDVTPFDLGSAGVDFDLFLTLSWSGDELHADLAYSADLFTPEGAARLVAGLGDLLAAGLQEPDAPMNAPRRRASAAPAPLAPVSRQPVALASSFPAGEVIRTMELWSGLLRPRLAIAATPAGQILRPLLDADGPLGADPDGLNVVLLRWNDVVPDGPDAVSRLERALIDVCEAIRGFRRRTPARLLIGVAPAPDGAAAAATARLRRFCRGYAGVEVVALDPWLARYGADPADTGFAAVAGTLIARRAYRPWIEPVRTVVLDPDGLAAPAAAAAVALEQVRSGRDVVLSSPPASARLRALVDTGAVRVADAANHPADCLVLAPDAAAAEVLRARNPEAVVIAAGTGDAAVRAFAARLWLLDPPAALPASGVGPPADLLAELAAELPDGASIRAAVESGYRRAAERRSAAPRDDREQAMAAIWADLLRLDHVGIHDDFFDLGGDSLLAMQVVFRAAQAGIAVVPRDLARHPTVAGLCAQSGTAVDAEQGVVTGEMPLTPAQEWFAQELAPSMRRPDHFNHPYYLEFARPVAPERLEAAVAALAAHHDALRLRFSPAADGAWHQHHAAPEGAVPFASHDLRDVPAAQRDGAVEALAADAQLQLDLSDGPTARVLHFRLGAGDRERLLVVAHHLVTDAVSRGILLDDLQALLAQPGGDATAALPRKTTAYRTWALRLAEEATSEATRAELPFWLEQAGDDAAVPTGITTLGTLASLDTVLTDAETAALHDAARKLGTGIRELLVWATAAAYADAHGTHECTVATTGHGREQLFEELDVSRTVGWFQVLYPLRLRLREGSGALDSFAAVAHQLRRVPRNGIGYGLLRHAGDPATRRRLAALAPPRIAVNYMGGFGFEEAAHAGGAFTVCGAPFGPTEDPTCVWPFEVDVAGSMAGGRLRVELSYGTQAYGIHRAEALLAALRARLLRLTADHPTAASSVPLAA